MFFQLVNGMNKLSQNKLNFLQFICLLLLSIPELAYIYNPRTFVFKDTDELGKYGNYLCNYIELNLKIDCLDITKRMREAVAIEKSLFKKTLEKNLFYPPHEIHMSKVEQNLQLKVFNWIVFNN